jgi:uncharacterized protein YdiU (UPF0061 family)
MKTVNPKYSWREWLVVPAYQQAARGDYGAVRTLQAVMTQPYARGDAGDPFYALKPASAFGTGGISHMSCSS